MFALNVLYKIAVILPYNQQTALFIRLWVICTNVDPNLIADRRTFKAKYLQNSEENWTKKYGTV